METTAQKISSIQYEIDVQVPWEETKERVDKQLSELAKTAQLKGFRKGKAPKNVVRQVYAKKVKADVAANLVYEGLIEAYQKHELRVVGEPQLDLPVIKDGAPLSFKATVEVWPELESVNLENMELFRPPVEVNDEQVEKAMEELRERRSTVEEPSPMRPVQTGDVIRVDFAVEVDGEKKEELGSQNRVVEVGEDQLLPEVQEAFLGMNVDETKTVPINFDDKPGQDDLKGKKVQMELKVIEIKEKVLPELDDEFAKDVGEFETLLELRLDVRKNIEKAAVESSETALKDQAVEALIKNNDIEAPPTLVENQKQEVFKSYQSFLQQNPMAAEVIKEMERGAEERAERQIKAAILFGALSKIENISVEEADIEEKFNEIAEKAGVNVAKVKARYQQGHQREQLVSQILENKLLDFVISKANVKEGNPPEKAKTEKAETKEEAK